MWVVVGPRATATAVRRSAAVEADVITSLRLAGGTFSWGTLFAAPYCGVEVRVQQDPPGRPGRSPFEVFEPHHASTASSSTKAPSNSAPTSLSSASMQTHTEVSCNPRPPPRHPKHSATQRSGPVLDGWGGSHGDPPKPHQARHAA